jgi:hypothetical protein
VGVIGNKKPEALPPIELDLSKLPEGTPKIAGTEVKWERYTDAYKQSQPKIPDDLEEKTLQMLQETAVAAFQALALRDYARIDIRLDKKKRPFVLEVNPNPYLLSTAELALAAKSAGRNYADMIGEIIKAAAERYGMTPNGAASGGKPPRSLLSDKSLQETYAPGNVCFGCGPANSRGLRIRSFPEGNDVVCEWTPETHHEDPSIVRLLHCGGASCGPARLQR